MMTMPNEEGLEKDSIYVTMVRSDSRGNDVRTVAITDEGASTGILQECLHGDADCLPAEDAHGATTKR